MDLAAGKLYAVITGDIVGSKKLPDAARRKLHAILVEGARMLCETFPDALSAPPDVYRGDAWQVVVADPHRSLRIGLFYRAHIKSAMENLRTDTRMAIAVGSIDFIPGDRASAGDGQAYRLSGKLMESLGRPYRMAFTFGGRETSALVGALQVVVQLVDVLAAGWSVKQARAVTGALLGWTQEKIASACWPAPISQQAVAQHLDRAGWHAIEKGVRYFETTIGDLIEKTRSAAAP
jgi:hypothetical protein